MSDKQEWITNLATQLLQKGGFHIVHDTANQLAIAFCEKYTLNESPTGLASMQVQIENEQIQRTLLLNQTISIKELREIHKGPARQKTKGCTCTNKEARERIDILEKKTKALMNEGAIKDLFTKLPLTKTNVFPRHKSITVFAPNIRYIRDDGYDTVSDVALQLRPVTILNLADPIMDPILIPNRIMTLEINPQAIITKQTPVILHD